MIRPCTPEDADAICRIYNPYIAQTIITFEEEPVSPAEMRARIAKVQGAGYPWLVMEAAGDVVGYTYAKAFHERAAYRHSVETSIFLAPGRRRQGRGRALYEALFAALPALDIHMILAGISLPNAASVGLHEALGFKKVAHYPEVGFKFGNWVDVGFWARPMDGAA